MTRGLSPRRQSRRRGPARSAGLRAPLLTAAVLALTMARGAGAEHLQVVGATGRMPAAGLQLDTGHQGAVTHLVPWAAGSLLVSAGADGTVRVWEPRDGALRRTVRLAEGDISAVVLHPWLPRAYAVVSDGTGLRLVGWDWQRERQLFSVDPGVRPLFLGLSRSAGSLLVGRASFDGLWLLDAATGEPQPGLERGSGIVTFAATSRDERTVLTYQPSGALTYRYRETGQVQRSLSVPSELNAPRLSGDRRHLIGRIGEWLVSVDAVNGVEVDRRRVEGLRLMKLWAAADRVLIVADGEHGLELRSLPLTAGRFGEPVLAQRLHGMPTALGHGRAEIFVGLADGTILRLDPRGLTPAFTVFARDERLAMIDVAVTGDTIALGTEAGAVAITADFVPGGPLWLFAGARTGIEAHVFRRPFGVDADGAARVTALDDDRVLVWSAAGVAGIAVLDLEAARIGPPQQPLAAPIANLDVADGTIAAVDRGGQAALLAARTGPFVTAPQDAGASQPQATVFETLFRAAIPGTTDVVAGERAGAQALIAALTSFGTFGTSIVSIAVATRETVPVRDPRNFVYDLAYDPRSRTLYSLGVQTGSAARTSLKSHAGPGLDQRRTLFEVPVEDLRAGAAVDVATGRVYFSLDGRVRMWDGRRIRALAATGREARQLAVHGGRVYAVNADGTLSIWSAYTLAHQFDLHLWRDFEWLVTSPARYWTSRGGARYVRD